MGLSNCATAQAQVPPNIDFCLLLDNSPSMALPATQSGLSLMQSLTQKEATGGCAFACHQMSTNNGDTAGNPRRRDGADLERKRLLRREPRRADR